MNITSVQLLIGNIAPHVSKDTLQRLTDVFISAVKDERQNMIDFAYRCRELDDITHVYSGSPVVFKHHPERLFEDTYINDPKKAIETVLKIK